MVTVHTFAVLLMKCPLAYRPAFLFLEWHMATLAYTTLCLDVLHGLSLVGIHVCISASVYMVVRGFVVGASSLTLAGISAGELVPPVLLI